MFTYSVIKVIWFVSKMYLLRDIIYLIVWTHRRRYTNNTKQKRIRLNWSRWKHLTRKYTLTKVVNLFVLFRASGRKQMLTRWNNECGTSHVTPFYGYLLETNLNKLFKWCVREERKKLFTSMSTNRFPFLAIKLTAKCMQIYGKTRHYNIGSRTEEDFRLESRSQIIFTHYNCIRFTESVHYSYVTHKPIKSVRVSTSLLLQNTTSTTIKKKFN